MRLIYHPDAEAELIKAAQFYERRIPQLALSFSRPHIMRWRPFSMHQTAGASSKLTCGATRCGVSHTSFTIGSYQSICAFLRLRTTVVILITGASVRRDSPRTSSILRLWAQC